MDKNKNELSYRFKNPTDLTKIAVAIFYVYLAISVFLIISSFNYFQHLSAQFVIGLKAWGFFN